MQFPTTRSAAAFLCFLTLTSQALAVCAPDKVSVRGDFGSAQFSVEIADDPDERALGLMNRPSMPTMAGMLFIYEEPSALTFWMRNTLIPLDMIFVAPDGRIQHIHENAIPHDETNISGGDGNLAVLELNGGLSRRLGLGVGDELRHPAFAEYDPVWPCP